MSHIPEEQIPKLKIREGKDPSLIVLANQKIENSVNESEVELSNLIIAIDDLKRQYNEYVNDRLSVDDFWNSFYHLFGHYLAAEKSEDLSEAIMRTH